MFSLYNTNRQGLLMSKNHMVRAFIKCNKDPPEDDAVNVSMIQDLMFIPVKNVMSQ